MLTVFLLPYAFDIIYESILLLTYVYSYTSIPTLYLCLYSPTCIPTFLYTADGSGLPDASFVLTVTQKG